MQERGNAGDDTESRDSVRNEMKLKHSSERILIYGAKSIALGVCCAIEVLFPEKEILGFLVSKERNNPKTLRNLPVMGIAACGEELGNKGIEKAEITVLIGTPETVHPEIVRMLVQYGFSRYICIDWSLEEKLMEGYYLKSGNFPSLHSLKYSCESRDLISDRFRIFLVKSHKDSDLAGVWKQPEWMHTLQAGAAQTELRIAEYTDHTGENISWKNSNYCELTALYWIWKNVLNKQDEDDGYCGLFQYRRMLHIESGDIGRIFENQPDVILPFPMLHEPDIREHHTRYMKEEDWHAMLQALEELRPDYLDTFQKLLKEPFLYNYNIAIAKTKILKDYCSWLFPILERTEELSSPKGWERSDRYIGYLGENLMTLYFRHHAKRLKIVHVGRVMLV